MFKWLSFFNIFGKKISVYGSDYYDKKEFNELDGLTYDIEMLKSDLEITEMDLRNVKVKKETEEF